LFHFIFVQHVPLSLTWPFHVKIYFFGFHAIFYDLIEFLVEINLK
jgi:hypothetical protein